MADLLEKIASMLLVGFRGLTLEKGDEVVGDIRDRGVGGTILFDVESSGGGGERNIRNEAQVRYLVQQLHSLAPKRLLVSVDEEGGRVSRLKEKYGFASTLTARFLGERDDINLTGAHADHMAGLLSELGINWNHAPVVDLDVNPGNPAIGRYGRSFSADPEVVTRHALAVIEAHHRRGVMCTLKHFPGHGSSANDSHSGMVDISRTWTEKELEPYRNIIYQGKADAVMTAHVFHRRFDSEYPATMSQALITGLLREKLGFEGIVVSDDMQMGAIRKHYPLETAVKKVLEAGVDMMVFGNNLVYEPGIVERVTGMVLGWVEGGELKEGRIEESYRRIREFQRRANAMTVNPVTGE